jgi:two-component system, OmpR family, sensor histidine kinase BaeS
MSLRWRIATGFALVALATAVVLALAVPPIVYQGFSDYDSDNDGDATAQATMATGVDTDGKGSSEAADTTILRLTIAAVCAAAAASLLGLYAAGRLVRPLKRLEQAAGGVARGDLSARSGLAARHDEFGRLGRSFDSMAEELEAAESTRRRFLQDAVHELKTPLAVIDATSSAILDEVWAPERRHISTIRDQSRLLARIVDDLRTISLAEVGNLPLDIRPVSVRGALDSVAAAFEARAAACGIALEVGGPADLVADADADRLSQMLGALLDNALRHTPDGGRIRLEVEPAVEAGAAPAGHGNAEIPGRGLVRVLVYDSGPGIPPDSLARIFERFYQADTSRSRESGTSGLGLSIVRALAEAQGGRVGAANRPGGGARFWVELPAAGRGSGGRS